MKTNNEQNSAATITRDIVIFRPELIEFGGEERVILALARKLLALGKAVSVACYYDSIGLSDHADFPLKVHQIRPKRNPISKVISLRLYLAALHQAGAPTAILFSIQSAYHAGLAVHSPYHLWIPDTYSLLSGPSSSRGIVPCLKNFLKNIPRHWGTLRGIRCAERFITNSQELQREMTALYGRSADVIYLGGEGKPLPAASSRPANPIHLLSVSRLQSSKRIDWALKALARQPDLPSWIFHIVGKGPEADSLAASANALGIHDKVVFHGFVGDRDLDELYRRSHIFLIPARQGYGLPALEALYRGVAVVISDESGVVELLKNTQWVAVASGGVDGFGVALRTMMLRVTDPRFFDFQLPQLPTEEGWASEIVHLCGW